MADDSSDTTPPPLPPSSPPPAASSSSSLKEKSLAATPQNLPQSEQQQSPILAKLKINNLLHIWSFLDVKSLLEAAKVCRTFRVLSNTGSIWQRHCESLCGGAVNEKKREGAKWRYYYGYLLRSVTVGFSAAPEFYRFQLRLVNKKKECDQTSLYLTLGAEMFKSLAQAISGVMCTGEASIVNFGYCALIFAEVPNYHGDQENCKYPPRIEVFASCNNPSVTQKDLLDLLPELQDKNYTKKSSICGFTLLGRCSRALVLKKVCAAFNKLMETDVESQHWLGLIMMDLEESAAR